MNLAFYNEIDPFAAAWLRELISRGLIAPGVVDDRSITEIDPDELTRYTQVHLFAGIGGWSHALRLAGWPDDRPVWTGSCPCQPFSSAGGQQGESDPRHLWPAMRLLVAGAKPAIAFGEQVASNLGRDWLTGVRADLEALGYEVGATDLCAAGVGAPHIRQRLYWVADSGRDGRGAGCGECGDEESPRRGRDQLGSGREAGGLGKPIQQGPQGLAGDVGDGREPGRLGAGQSGSTATAGDALGFWSAFDLIHSRGGKARRVEPGTFPLAHGASARVGRLRGYGNAIVPQVAAAFITASIDSGAGVSV